MRVELRIDRLVLEGIDLPAGQHQLVGAHVQAELARLLRDGGLAGPPGHGGAVATARGPALHLPAGLPPPALGRLLAGAIYQGIQS
jgi:hypothetical protein